MKSISVKRKKRGRPATGTDRLYGVRIADDLMTEIEKWGEKNGTTSRSEAIRRLVELGLSGSPSSRPHSPKALSKSADMAHDALDRQADQTATPEEQARRKRRLVKGPKEFRDIRKDHK